ncbi:MAG: RNA polymerase sigma factor, partial [Planctomycetes bacterium]|nr:RNA polymerase sigma factor [Planctomycetota bacterium]
MSSLEDDFLAFVDRRDPDALGRVFDATAGRLLLLSTHLVGADASAEDLVQATFLAAMRRGATWERGRPLWPWLAAILHNEARMLWRQRRRSREVGLESAQDRGERMGDPASLAGSDEVVTAVAAAIDAMSVEYRQVMRLRLMHGLRPIEIARALELPVNTVRVRLHRGRDRLRGTLPASVGVVVAALLSGEGLLAQVRVAVMAEAGVVP